MGDNAALADATPGGSWSSANTAVATVSTSGLVTAVSAGTATISYTNSLGCAATKVITVNPSPSAITPASASVCVAGTTALTNTVSGGAWSSSNTAVATVSSGTGIVTGVAAGSATITYAIGSCRAIATVTVEAPPNPGVISGPATVCTGNAITLTDPVAGGVWSSSNASVASVGVGTGIVTGVSAGTATISYTVFNICGPVSATFTVTVLSPGVASIVGPSSLCAGTFATYTNATTGGSWSVTNASATITGTGLLTGITPGLDTIRYTVSNACGAYVTTTTVSIGTYLSAGTISGPSSVCPGAIISLTDPVPGGTWSASNSRATVSGAGVVTGVTSGVDTIMYTVTASCGSAVATKTVTVLPTPDAGTISGPSTICIGDIVIYTSTTPGGVWALTNTTIAGISGSGVVSAFATGLDTIRYTVTNSCGTASTMTTVNIGAVVTAGTISGPSVVCTGATITLTDAVAGGVWSSSNPAVATVGSTGIVTGITAGTTNISYTVTGSCGTATATKAVTVNLSPDAGTISGASSICTGTTATYTTTGTGGSWSFSNSNATVTSGGVVTGITAGSGTLSYTVTNSCGTVFATFPVTIGTTASAGTLSGPAAVCTGSSISLSASISGGSWSSSNTAVATVGGTGTVNGIASGTAVISYAVTNSCGTAVTTHTVTVSPAATVGAIGGSPLMCTGSFTMFTNSVSGGAWSSSNPTVASVTGTGLVTALSAGATTISYTVTTACSSATATLAVTVATGISAGTISGPASVCAGSAISLSVSATGGTWSATNGNATVGSTGIVTGVTAGLDTIMYSVPSSCGSSVATYVVSVVSGTSISPIAGPSVVCVGSLILLTDASPGGAWSASNAHATITTGGLVTGITPGIDTISYTISGVCGLTSATKIITVNLLPTVGAISGPATVCAGASIILTNPVAGGIWSASNARASVGSVSGIVTGVTAGADTIIYTVTSSCGSISTQAVITVNPLPSAGAVTGPDSVCAGTSITLSATVSGGVWTAGNTNATVSGGLVTGITGGTTPISYSVTNGCGTASAVKIITIVSFPVSGVISGSSAVCAGSGITLTSTAPGGTWWASNSNAIVAGPGIITGVTVGIDTIFYAVTNSCGTATTAKIITVNPVPVVSPVTGPTNHCVGTSITLSSVTTGGVWTSSDPSIASVGISSGIVTGIATGIVNITYTVTNSFGCPTSVTAADTINALLSLPAISGSANVCVGSATLLSDAVTGGSWSSSDALVASIGASSGLVTGMTAGTATITYTVTNSCGTTFTTRVQTVNPLPFVAPIMGSTHQCAGTTSTMSSASAGGIWTSSNPSVAVIGSSTGVVTAITPGVTTISYIYTGAFGCTSTIFMQDTVVASPAVAAITGPSSHCAGTTITLGNATAGGTWSTGSSIATVGATTGIVNGLSAGIAVINYTVTNSSGCSTTVSANDTIYAAPVVDTISGPSSVCIGATILLADATTGGTWSMTNSTAAVTSGGIVSGVAAGVDTAIYTVSNACGSSSALKEIVVAPAPTVSAITGAASVCVGATTTLSNATPGGVWSAANSNAAVTAAGVVTGLVAGIDTIYYTVTTGCGSATASHEVTIGSLPVVPAISGPSSVCNAASITLANAIGGGTWSSALGRVTVSSTGVVTGVTAGIDTVRYTITNACGSATATKVISVVQPPVAGTISGPAAVCVGFTISLSVSGGSTGGTWSSSNTAKANVSGGGVVTGVTPGSAIISYTVSNSCGSRSATRSITILSPADCGGGSHVQVNGVAASDTRIYPNPASAILYIESPVKVSVSVLSVDGKVLIAQKEATAIDVSHLANGMYLVQIFDEEGTLVKNDKFVKE